MKNISEKLKLFLAGFTVGCLMLGTVAFAATSKIEVVFENIKYMFDSVEKKPAGASGLIYKGNVYAPVSFIAKSLGKDFSYDSKSKTLWVGKKAGSFKYLDTVNYARKDSKSSLNGIGFAKWDKVRALDNAPSEFVIADSTYIHGIGAYFWYMADLEDQQSIEYNLNGKYKKLTGVIGIDDSDKNCVGYGKIKILGDGNQLYESEELKGGDLPRDMDIDITGIKRLKIIFEISGDQLDILIADAKLLQ